MRIVMLTPDSRYIDRRILQEAETLVAQGHEVILLAEWQEGLPVYERIGNVKVERLTSLHQYSSYGDRIILYLQHKLIVALGLLSLFLQRLITLTSIGVNKFIAFCAANAQRLINFTSLCIRKLISLISIITQKLLTWISLGIYKSINLISLVFNRFINFIARNTYKVIGLCALGVNTLAGLALRLSQKFKGLQLYEQAMLNRVIYYDPDVIHVHDLPYLNVGVRAKKRLKTSLVYDAHELYPEISTLTKKEQQRLGRIEKRSLLHCNQVITVNPFIAEEMARRYHISTPMVILNATTSPNGFKVASSQDLFRQQFPIPTEHQILLYQGWLSLERGLGKLVQAMAHVPESVHLVLMGYYSPETKQVLEQMIHHEGISARVHFKEAVSQAELLFWTASADAGIIPYIAVDLNTYYCSPNKLFEFIQAELPIIANDLPFLHQVVAGEEFGVVMPLTDVSSYAQAIRAMFNRDLGGPTRFKMNLHKKRSCYDWQVEAVKLVDIYTRLDRSDQ